MNLSKLIRDLEKMFFQNEENDAAFIGFVNMVPINRRMIVIASATREDYCIEFIECLANIWSEIKVDDVDYDELGLK